ncbi:MAG: NDP-sugar synthase [bacterium]|nr:NDP-sugar synthase [bacterium]
MKCILNIDQGSASWLETYFPEFHPLMLKIVNKPLIEYYIDLCVVLGINNIRITSDIPSEQLFDYLSDGTQWGVNITYSLSKSGDTLNNILEKNEAYISDDTLFLINNMIFLYYDKNSKEYNLNKLKSDTSFFSSKNGGCYLLKTTGKTNFSKMISNSENNLTCCLIDSLQSYFKITMDLLKNHSDNFVIPGYSSKDNVFIGQNVEISKMTEIKSPVAIADNVRLKDAAIGPYTVIGNNSLIDKMSKVENSIIYDNTYLGSELEIVNKLIYKNKIIDPDSGESLNITDEFIISKLGSKSEERIFEKALFRIIAFFTVTIQLPFYCVLILFTSIKYNKVSCIIDKNTKSTEDLVFIEQNKKSFFNTLFYKMSLNKFPLLLKVLTGRLYLTGNTPVQKGEKDLFDEMKIYRAAAFTINDMLSDNNEDEIVKSINELYYSNNMNFKLNLQIYIKSIIKKLFD